LNRLGSEAQDPGYCSLRMLVRQLSSNSNGAKPQPSRFFASCPSDPNRDVGAVLERDMCVEPQRSQVSERARNSYRHTNGDRWRDKDKGG
jgi:hypothetical protein